MINLYYNNVKIIINDIAVMKLILILLIFATIYYTHAEINCTDLIYGQYQKNKQTKKKERKGIIKILSILTSIYYV